MCSFLHYCTSLFFFEIQGGSFNQKSRYQLNIVTVFKYYTIWICHAPVFDQSPLLLSRQNYRLRPKKRRQTWGLKHLTLTNTVNCLIHEFQIYTFFSNKEIYIYSKLGWPFLLPPPCDRLLWHLHHGKKCFPFHCTSDKKSCTCRISHCHAAF